MRPVYRLLSDIIELIETGVPNILFILLLVLIYLAISAKYPLLLASLSSPSLHVTFNFSL